MIFPNEEIVKQIRNNEYVGVRIAEVCWRGRDYCITWVDGETCQIEKE